MEASTKTPTTLMLPWKTRLQLSAFSTVTHAARRRDGTVNRGLLNLFLPRIPSKSKPINGVNTYDVTVDPTRKLWFRVFVPTQHTIEDLPLIVYFHGDGFVFMSANEKHFDSMCRRMARKVPAVVVSVDYRLAPEHRYPAQHDDCFDVLKFLDDKNRSKSLLEKANISCCFLAGDSAGGNIAHHVAQRACEFDFQQLKVIGLVAIQPFFGGEQRTNSENELAGNYILSLNRTDWYWNVFMPPGEGYNRDHPIINVSGPHAVDISKMDFPATLVVVGGFDVLRDWQKRYYEWLNKSGKEAYLVEYPNMCHSFYIFPEVTESGHLISEVKDFIHKLLKKEGNV